MARGSLMVKYREMQVRTLSYPYGWVAQLAECGEMGVSKSLPQWAETRSWRNRCVENWKFCEELE